MSGEQYPGQHDLQSALDKPLTYVEPTADEEAAIAALPSEEQSLDQTFVTTSMRLPYPLHQALRAYTEARGTTVTTVLRQWIELHLTADDKPIRLEDAVRVLAALPEPLSDGHMTRPTGRKPTEPWAVPRMAVQRRPAWSAG